MGSPKPCELLQCAYPLWAITGRTSAWIAQPQQLSCTPMLVVLVDQEILNRERRCEKPGIPGFLLGIRKDHLETSNTNCQSLEDRQRVLEALAGNALP